MKQPEPSNASRAPTRASRCASFLMAQKGGCNTSLDKAEQLANASHQNQSTEINLMHDSRGGQDDSRETTMRQSSRTLHNDTFANQKSSEYISIYNNLVSDSYINTQHQKLAIEMELKERESQERSKQNVLFLKEEQIYRPFQEQPFDAKGLPNNYYQSPSITSNEVFYRDYKGLKRPSVAKPLPEYEGETIESHFRNHSDSSKKPVVSYKRLFLFDNHNETGIPFTKKTSVNMKNFSQVLIGSSDNIKDLYEKQAKKRVRSPDGSLKVPTFQTHSQPFSSNGIKPTVTFQQFDSDFKQ